MLRSWNAKGAEAGASQIGSRVAEWVDLYLIVKELVGTVEPRPQNIVSRKVPERDHGVAFTGGTACATDGLLS